MIPPAFDYHAPASLSEAIALLSRLGDSAKVLSGGQSLLPLLKLRLGTADHLIDIGRIPGLEYIREEGGLLRIGGPYLKLERKVGDYATAAAAAQVPLDASGGFDKVGLALPNAGPVPTRAAAAESFLTGRKASESSIAEGARKAAEAASPSADRRGSVEYKREMARVLATRALKLAVERAGGR